MSKAGAGNCDLLGTTPPIVLGFVLGFGLTPLGDVVTSGLVPRGDGGSAVPMLVEPAEGGLGGAAVPTPIEGWVGEGVVVPTLCANAEPPASAAPIAATNNDVRKDCLLDDIMKLLASQDGRSSAPFPMDNGHRASGSGDRAGRG